jgi:hypothetical protein
LPGGVRIHHTVLVYPFPQMATAAAGVLLWKCRFRHRPADYATKGIVIGGIVLLLAGQLSSIVRTQRLIHETGGRGRWSESLDEFCRTVDHHKELTIVSLDWGFNEQLNFLTEGPKLAEPIWRRDSAAWLELRRDPNVIYLVYAAEYAIVIRDPAQLLARAKDSRFAVDAYRDREGHVVFHAIRYRKE